MTLEQQYNQTAESFRLEIQRLADQSGKTPLAIYALWREYSKRCDWADQSALLSEFQEWYAKDLVPQQQAAVQEFETKKEDKIERLEDAAHRHQTQADHLNQRAHQMAGVIPFGQPILVGHHSERGDRAYRNRIHNTWSKASEEQDKAGYYQRRADNAASSHAITSDDPNADSKLAKKIADAEQLQRAMKDCNAAIRKHAKAGPAAQIAALVALGRTEAQAQELLKPDFCGRIGFPSYAITNNNANIRRMKQRLEQVAVAQATPETTIEGTHARFEDCPAANRVRLYFPGKPAEEIRRRLKSNGFRWAPTEGAWQAYRNYHSIATAKQEAGVTESPDA